MAKQAIEKTVAKDVKDVALELHKMLEKSGKSIITIPDEDLRTISHRERIRGSFLEQLGEEIVSIGHIFASGDKVHIVSHDTNHSPAKK